jgi:hypothetical protein
MPTTEDMLRDARWELRVWDLDETVHDRLHALNPDPDITAQVDCHLIGPRYEFTAKIRDGVLEVKQLLERRAGFQRWAPDWASEPPHEPKELNRLLVELGADRSEDLNPVSNSKLIDLVNTARGLKAVDVTKKRRDFDLGDVLAEISEIEIDGSEPRSCVLIESTSIDRMREMRDHLSLNGAPNVALHNAIKHMLPRLDRDADWD